MLLQKSDYVKRTILLNILKGFPTILLVLCMLQFTKLCKYLKNSFFSIQAMYILEEH